jgi:hypothetical protein
MNCFPFWEIELEFIYQNQTPTEQFLLRTPPWATPCGIDPEGRPSCDEARDQNEHQQ